MKYTADRIKTLVADNLRRCMKNKYYSPQDIADLSEGAITAQQVRMMLQVKSFISAKSLAMLCNILDVPPSELFAVDSASQVGSQVDSASQVGSQVASASQVGSQVGSQVDSASQVGSQVDSASQVDSWGELPDDFNFMELIA